MSNQDSKGKKELTEKDLEKAAGGAFDPGTGGGAVTAGDPGTDTDASGASVDPDTLHAIFPESQTKSQQ
jgi:hypothetical protein